MKRSVASVVSRIGVAIGISLPKKTSGGVPIMTRSPAERGLIGPLMRTRMKRILIDEHN